MQNPKIAIIWSRMPGYALACLTQLKKILGENLFIGIFGNPPIYISENELSLLGDYKKYNRRTFNKEDYIQILEDLKIFNPDVLIVTGWQFKVLRKVARKYKNKGKITVSMVDTPWKGKIHQIFKAFLGKQILKNSFTKVWVPGVSAKKLMKFSGYEDDSIWMNLYCCDTNVFKFYNNDVKENYFIYVGRLENEKNIVCLKKGFLDFKINDKKDFKLIVIGDGSMREILENCDYIECLGWKKSKDIVQYFRKSSGFILPSNYEPWGVVVHEAACSALPLILSDKVGARNEFLINKYNGNVFDSNSYKDLSKAIQYVSLNNDKNIMGIRSFEIASKFSLTIWCENLLNNIKDS